MATKQAGRRKKPTRRKKDLTPLGRLRSACLDLPEAHEVEAWGSPTFRIRNKLFAMYADADSHHTDGRPSVWVKSTLVNQDLLLHSEPGRFFYPPYVGPSGWIGIYLDKRPNWKDIAEILRDGYELAAPKRRSTR
ncbi:MAG TPA: MmcQ/YjbR family DNA-binding protein [Gemmatimonadaceae bacterium]|jgi:predicted DNA-binding protein (MmcQ/YjbR family)|nr:MmcQ/YjbR family DNA-binding protein [Gemmatimonadaceae bacterium]